MSTSSNINKIALYKTRNYALLADDEYVVCKQRFEGDVGY